MIHLDNILSTLSKYPKVTLVAVSKTVGALEVVSAYQQGLRHFGENKVQDALPKMDAIDLPISWHFIGRLQTNKVRKIAGRFAIIHSLDSIRLAEELDRVGKSIGHVFECLVQVNASGEQTKQGLAPSMVHQFIADISSYSNVHVSGLMTMAAADGRGPARETFRSVRRLYDELATVSIPGVKMEYLSMGMSGDYEVALDEGSNMVRIGSAIFCNRN